MTRPGAGRVINVVPAAAIDAVYPRALHPFTVNETPLATNGTLSEAKPGSIIILLRYMYMQFYTKDWVFETIRCV